MSRPEIGTETEALLSYLNNQRGHVLGIMEGLSEENLRRPVLPSGWTCVGLVQHLALDVERFGFRAIVAGEPFDLDGPNAWLVASDVPAAAVFHVYREEIERANAIIAATPPDAAPAWWPGELFGNVRPHPLREIVLHVMTETACQAGQLDAVHELIDRHAWLLLTERVSGLYIPGVARADS
jgi:uncharacterized protein DUF664